jgi:hypothetical protein
MDQDTVDRLARIETRLDKIDEEVRDMKSAQQVMQEFISGQTAIRTASSRRFSFIVGAVGFFAVSVSFLFGLLNYLKK